MSSLNHSDILPQQTTQGSQAQQQSSAIINKSNQWVNLPNELKERAQWVIADKNKTPYQCNGRKASPTDPSTWTDFHTACTYAKLMWFRMTLILGMSYPHMTHSHVLT